MFTNVTPTDKRTAAQYSPLALAYLGDCVYELNVREFLLLKANRSNGKLHNDALKYVSASAQAQYFERILPILTEEEESVFKRGRNSNSSPHKNSDIGEYKTATGLETLIGYLYLSGQNERLTEIFNLIFYDENINVDKGDSAHV